MSSGDSDSKGFKVKGYIYLWRKESSQVEFDDAQDMNAEPNSDQEKVATAR